MGVDSDRLLGGVNTDGFTAARRRSRHEAVANESLGELWQLSRYGSRRSRVSCNRGEQFRPATAGGGQVVWLDATNGSTDLMAPPSPGGAGAVDVVDVAGATDAADHSR
ncbi:hypothetical protein ABZ543_17150 [Streptomyces roseifaciens]